MLNNRIKEIYMEVLLREPTASELLITLNEEELIKMGCPKINLMVRNSNLDVQEFYKHIGYEEQEVLVFGKRLIPDN